MSQTATITKTTGAVETLPDAASGSGLPSRILPQFDDARQVAPADARELSRLFLIRLRSLEEGTREYQYTRNTLIEMNISLVNFAARRFRSRAGDGVDIEDIVQVGTIGLIKAIDRFDPDREVEFSTLALPYISGEIKRFFRDTTWAVHVPRRLQELRAELAKSQDALTEAFGRAPTVKELAEHLELSEDDVIEGLVAANGYTSGSLDAATSTRQRTSGETEGRSLAETVGEVDPDMELFEEFHTLAPLLQSLDERDRRILAMRFGQEMTQAEIGTELGISQMQVSRLLTRVLTRLRTAMLAE
ncbi:SigB/SigF/SigG family RNA polymerase sigma factor [Streptomyces goshikiensis]|uniref:SigB/SigF/SigG family RNA polymerase sigma factor n=1 Tax=Streptomyces goshikiensis TaxID=1942 RepID=UPI00368269AE